MPIREDSRCSHRPSTCRLWWRRDDGSTGEALPNISGYTYLTDLPPPCVSQADGGRYSLYPRRLDPRTLTKEIVALNQKEFDRHSHSPTGAWERIKVRYDSAKARMSEIEDPSERNVAAQRLEAVLIQFIDKASVELSQRIVRIGEAIQAGERVSSEPDTSARDRLLSMRRNLAWYREVQDEMRAFRSGTGA